MNEWMNEWMNEFLWLKIQRIIRVRYESENTEEEKNMKKWEKQRKKETGIGVKRRKKKEFEKKKEIKKQASKQELIKE